MLVLLKDKWKPVARFWFAKDVRLAMKESFRPTNSFRSGSTARLVLAAAISTALPTFHAQAVDRIKANNTTALNLDGSWTTVQPTSVDVAVWDSTVLAANTSALGGNLSWQGIRIANPGGLATVTFAAGQSLTLGSSGIDLSAATQNLTLMSPAVANTAGTLAISASQTWSVATGRTLTLFNTSNTANQSLTGSGNIQVTTAGTGQVTMNVGDATSTAFSGGGNSGFSGNWTIGTGAAGSGKVVTLRNGINAWGTGSITLNGGTIAQSQGAWAWANNIILQTGTTSTIDDANTGGTRTLKLYGVLSGDGNLTFAETGGGAHTVATGHILTNANTLSGTVTVSSPAVLRIGGVPGANNTLTAGSSGDLGTAVVVNNGTITLSRDNTWAFANNITSGTGAVTIGGVTGTLVGSGGTQVVTMSGTSAYTGATTVGQGRLNLTGSLTSAITVQAAGKISGNGSTTGLLTLSSGAGLILAGGATTSGLSANGATFGGSNLVTFLADPIPSTVYNVFTYGAGAVTTPGNLSVGWRGTLSNDVPNLKYIFTAGASGTRTWNTTTGTWAQGTGANFAEGDQLFYGGDTVIFNEPASASVVTLSGRLAPASVSVNNTTNAYTLSGTDGTADITGSSTLTKTNGGTLILTSAQTYTGTTAVNGGIVDVGNGGTTGALGTGALNVAGGAELIFNRSNAFTVSNTISGAGLVTKKGTGRMTVNGNSSSGVVHWNFTGTGTGDIGFQNASAIGGTGSDLTLTANAVGGIFFSTNGNTSDLAMSLGNGAVLTLNGSTSFTNTYSGVISGAGAITKVSGETLRITGVNTYTGTTTITTGTLEIGDAGQLGSGNYAGNIDKAATLAVNTTANQTITGVISGAGAITKANNGTLVLTANNTHSGSITISGGVLEVSANGPYRNGDGTAAFNSAAIVTINTGGTLKLKSFEYNGDGGLGGLRDFAANRVINGGTLEVAGASQTSGNDFTIGASGGVFRYNPANPAHTLTLAGNANTNIPIAGTLTFKADGNISVGEIIEGAGGLAKTGAGTLALTAANTYAGATNITAGTVSVSGSISGSLTSVSGTGILSGTGSVGNLSLDTGGNLAPGSSPGVLNSGSTTFNGGTLAIELNSATLSTGYDQLNVVGTVTLAANTPLTIALGFDPVDDVDFFTIVNNDLAESVIGAGLFSFAGNPLSQGEQFTVGVQDFTISYTGGDGNDIVLAAVPEPASIAMLLGGLGLLAARRRRTS